jgi:hypothetical protein
LRQRKTITFTDGASWNVLKQGENFMGADLDSQSQLWVSYSEGLLQYNGDTWQEHAFLKSTLITQPVLDGSDRVWLGSLGGLVSFDPKSGWAELEIDSQPAVDRGVTSLAVDAAGRIWAGTAYGLAVYDGKNWQAYHMHTADLKSNQIEAIKIYGDPGLPEPLSKPSGSLSGRIASKSGASATGLPVEICVTSFGILYTGKTPCSSQPFHRSTTTDDRGNFAFSDLPAGFYFLSFQVDGKWKYMTTGLGTGSASYQVEPGEKTRVEEIQVD